MGNRATKRAGHSLRARCNSLGTRETIAHREHPAGPSGRSRWPVGRGLELEHPSRAYSSGSFTAEVRFSVDGRVLAFTLLISLGAGILFGLAPAWQASRSSVNDLLKGGSALPRRSRYSPRVRNLLITLEVAVALVLVAGAALLVKSFVQLHNVDFGFDPHQVLAVTINLPERSHDARKSADYLQAIVERVQSLPGVESASVSKTLPFAPHLEGLRRLCSTDLCR